MLVRTAAVAASSVLVGVILVPASAGADEQPTRTAPRGVTISKIDVFGSGCRRDTAAVAVSEDRRAFTVTYSDYLAQVGPDSRIRDQRRDCRVNVRVSVPAGFTFGITGVDHRGYAQLAEGATALHRSGYDFGRGLFGLGGRRSGGEQTFRGPMDSNWEGRTTAARGADMAPCGSANTLNVHSELTVRAGGPNRRSLTSYITMDSTDGEFKTTFSWEWRRCGLARWR